MALYRVLTPLSRGDVITPKGQIVSDHDWPTETLEILERKGKIAPLSPPPLATLPGWKTCAERLAEIGILDAEQFVEASDDQIGIALSGSPETFGKWRQELLNWLVIPQPGG